VAYIEKKEMSKQSINLLIREIQYQNSPTVVYYSYKKKSDSNDTKCRGKTIERDKQQGAKEEKEKGENYAI
jgi:hypothetical protein